MTLPFFTIGHSDQSLEEFLELLRAQEVTQIVDVRKLPGSRKYPHFNEDALAASLSEAGIRYVRIEELTGRRPVSKEVDFEVNAFWKNRSFHNYADYALSDEFRRGLARLREIGTNRQAAVMCSEAVWWRCHRRLIVDNLLAEGNTVFHIMSEKRADPASITPGAVTHRDRTVTYPKTGD